MRPILALAFERGPQLFGVDHVLSELLAGEQQLWLVVLDDRSVAGCGTTRIVQHPAMKVCEVPIIAGADLGAWLSKQPEIEEWARQQGCREMIGFPRDGLERVLRPFGWERFCSIVRKPLYA